MINLGVINEDVICAALLHDTLEDTTTTEKDLTEKFNAKITEIVKQVTSDKSAMTQIANEQFSFYKSNIKCETSWVAEMLNQMIPSVKDTIICKRQGKSLYITRKLNTMDLDALLVKLSDRIDNLRDISFPPPICDDTFYIEYYIETRFMFDHLDKTRYNEGSVHAKLVDELCVVLHEMLGNIRSRKGNP